MNLVIMAVYNTTAEQLELTKQAVASVFAQDIPVSLWIVNNGSTQPTQDWLDMLEAPSPHALYDISHNPENVSPVLVANAMLGASFALGGEYVLGVANDVVLPSNFFRELLKWPRGIVTASMTSEVGLYSDSVYAVSEFTPMAVGLIRKWCHDALVDMDGYFLDPRFFHYCSDCSLALRMSQCGIRGIQLSIPYWHSGSASWRKGEPAAAKKITDQADVDRETFKKIFGFGVSDDAYGAACDNINFRGESK